MSLTDFRTLGRSGLVVSPLALGTMTFGPGGWGADETTSRAIFDAYRAAGGNFVDTADIYTGGRSEELVGRFIADSGARDDIVLATKFAFNGSASPLTATQAGGGNPNAGGAGAKNIHRALDASLKAAGQPTTSTFTGCTSGTASRPSRKSSRHSVTSCGLARYATTACRTCPPGWR